MLYVQYDNVIWIGVDIPLFPEQVTVDLNQVGDVIGGDVCVAGNGSGYI